jgi:hypothetical protein
LLFPSLASGEHEQALIDTLYRNNWAARLFQYRFSQLERHALFTATGKSGVQVLQSALRYGQGYHGTPIPAAEVGKMLYGLAGDLTAFDVRPARRCLRSLRCRCALRTRLSNQPPRNQPRLVFIAGGAERDWRLGRHPPGRSARNWAPVRQGVPVLHPAGGLLQIGNGFFAQMKLPGGDISFFCATFQHPLRPAPCEATTASI